METLDILFIAVAICLLMIAWYFAEMALDRRDWRRRKRPTIYDRLTEKKSVRPPQKPDIGNPRDVEVDWRDEQHKQGFTAIDDFVYSQAFIRKLVNENRITPEQANAMEKLRYRQG